MIIFIRNMVSARCKLIVKQEAERLGITCKSAELGKIETENPVSITEMTALNLALSEFGLDVIENRKLILVERIKLVVIEMVHYSETQLRCNFSAYLSSKLNLDYTYLANVFSESEGTTIEHYVILHRIQRAKELLGYNDLNLTEISWKLGYSSVAHLSTQFKKVTGLTASHFRQLNHAHQISGNV